MNRTPVVDSALVERVAGIVRDAAAEHLLPCYSGSGIPARRKSCGGLVTEVDNAMQEAIGRALAEAYLDSVGG